MARKALKWLAFSVGGLLALLALAVAAVYLASEARINAAYAVVPAAIAIPADAAAVARGRHLATSVVACEGCHGEDYSGTMLADDPALGRITASNLTTGVGGVGSVYTDQDWVRAIRHGVRPDGSALLFMPAHEYNRLSAEDLGAVIAYLKTLPPVDNTLPDDRVGPVARLLFLAGQFPLVPAELIDHAAPPPPAVESGPTAAYGEYLAIVCSGCHGENLSGGPIPGGPPDAAPAANLTPHASGLAGWTEADFFRVLREGVGPDGAPVDEFMPWRTFGNMEDDEIRAIWLYLQTLDPLPVGSR